MRRRGGFQIYRAFFEAEKSGPWEIPSHERIGCPRQQSGTGKDEGIWASCFYKKPHSNDDLRKLIPLALDDLAACEYSTDWKQPFDLPHIVLEWFLGQKQILFASVVKLSCPKCKKPVGHDTSPRWAVHMPGCYIIPYRRCTCGHRRQSSVADAGVAHYTTAQARNLYQPPASSRKFDFEPYIQRLEKEGGRCLLPVECWCIRCKEKTELYDITRMPVLPMLFRPAVPRPRLGLPLLPL